ncbi:MAG: hypothetical protein EAX96_06275 [Candidatus Lokiarchaeota archaeon]|nr:hypothetical protein [Candidatus Lokiarchaeota archaeon]
MNYINSDKQKDIKNYGLQKRDKMIKDDFWNWWQEVWNEKSGINYNLNASEVALINSLYNLILDNKNNSELKIFYEALNSGKIRESFKKDAEKFFNALIKS